MSELLEEVKAFYATQVKRKLRDFVEGNDRVELAWQTIEQWAPPNPRRILEVGCGIGHISWRLSRRWPCAHVLGWDISGESITLAQKLFASSRLSFVQGAILEDRADNQFDLIVLMDVYEHLPSWERPRVHDMLKERRSDEGRIVLSFPTPRHLAWLRMHQPKEIQPVDENVNASTIVSLANDVECDVLLYQEVGVWHEGDYAHAVLGKRSGWAPVIKRDSEQQGIRTRISQLLVKKAPPLIPSRASRLDMVRQRLGEDFQ